MSPNLKTYDTDKYTLQIDLKNCIGCGTCVALAPSTFVVNPKTFKTEVKPPPHDNPATILAAAQACPTSGIIVIDKATGKKVWPK